MALRIPHIMFTAVDSITGEESEPLIFSVPSSNDFVLTPSFSVTRVYRVDTLNSRAGYEAGPRRIAVRIGHGSTAVDKAMKSGLYGQFTFSSNSTFRSTVENRVCRLTKISLPISSPGTNFDDYLVEGNFDIPSGLSSGSLSGVGLRIASPLFTDMIKHDINATKKANQADVDAGRAGAVNQPIADQDARKPKEFTWGLPRIINADHYVLYALGSDGNFHESDVTTETTYRISEDSTYESIFDLANEEGRIYSVGQFPFKTAGDYPGAVGLYKQRKIFASTNRKPDTIWFSQIGNYSNFITDSGDKDPIEVTVASSRIEKINHIVPIKGLFFLSEGGAWGIEEERRLTPSEISLDKISEEAAAPNINATTLSGNLLHGSYCRDDVQHLIYNFSEDNFAEFRISILARHLFDSPIRNIAVKYGVVNNIACVTDAGDIVIAAINKSDKIIAWGKWTRENHNFKDILSDPKGEGFYVVVEAGGDSFLEFIRLSDCGASQAAVYQDDSTNYPFSLELLPFENEEIGIRDRVSISDIFVKVSDTKRFSASLGSSTFSYPEAGGDASASISGTIELPVSSSWDRDSKLSITDTSSEAVEILSVAVEGRVARHEGVGDISDTGKSFEIQYPQRAPKPEKQPIQKGVSELFNDVYPDIPRNPEPEETGRDTTRKR